MLAKDNDINTLNKKVQKIKIQEKQLKSQKAEIFNLKIEMKDKLAKKKIQIKDLESEQKLMAKD